MADNKEIAKRSWEWKGRKIKTKFMTIVNYLKLLFWAHQPDVRKKATSIQVSLHFSVRFSTRSNYIDIRFKYSSKSKLDQQKEVF